MEPTNTISSTKNPLVRRFRDAAVGEHEGLLLAEGTKLVGEALDAGLAVVEAAYSERLERSELGGGLLARLQRACPALHRLAPGVMARVSQVKTPPGVIAVLRRPLVENDELLGAESEVALLTVAAGLRDPGNLGALIRTSEAAGATGVAALSGGADPWREKAVRGSSGERVPLAGRWRHGARCCR